MNRGAVGDGSSDVAVADVSAADGPWTTRDRETLYRRPPARPRAAEDADPGWFAPDTPGWSAPDALVSAPGTGRRTLDGRRSTTTGEQRAVQIPADPEYGPDTPGGLNRASFGFSAGPISPVRQTSAPPAPPAPAKKLRRRQKQDLPVRTRDAASSTAASPAAAPEDFPLPSPDVPAFAAPAVPPAEGRPTDLTGRPGDFSRWLADPGGRSEGGRSGGDRSEGGRSEGGWSGGGRSEGDRSGGGWSEGRSGGGWSGDPGGRSGDRGGQAAEPGGWPESGGRSGDIAARSAEEPAGWPGGEPADWPGDAAGWAGGGTGERRPVRQDAASEAPRVEGPRQFVEPPRQSRAVTFGIVLLSVIVLLAGAVVGAVYFAGPDGKLESVLQLGAGDTGRRTVTAPLDNRTAASFELLAGANKVQVSIGELGDDLYRISTPEDAGIRPSPEIRNDDVKLQVIRDGDGIGGEIEVVLAAKVRWALRFSGYAEQQVVNLTGGQVSGIEMVAGIRRAELTLARPTGTVPVKINGAVENLLVKSPAGNPVRVRVDGGAKTVVAGSRTLQNVPAGSTLTPRNWATQNRYDVAAGARITSLTVESA